MKYLSDYLTPAACHPVFFGTQDMPDWSVVIVAGVRGAVMAVESVQTRCALTVLWGLCALWGLPAKVLPQSAAFSRVISVIRGTSPRECGSRLLR